VRRSRLCGTWSTSGREFLDKYLACADVDSVRAAEAEIARSLEDEADARKASQLEDEGDLLFENPNHQSSAWHPNAPLSDEGDSDDEGVPNIQDLTIQESDREGS
jgi:hypothetical protein